MSPVLCCCNIYPQARGCFLGYISSPCCSSRRVFLPYQKLRRLLSAAPSRRVRLSTCTSSAPVTYSGTRSGTDKQAVFSVFVDSINNISWSKRKVGPVVYVTELGTLESATAPLAACPHAASSLGLETMTRRIKNNTHSDHFAT